MNPNALLPNAPAPKAPKRQPRDPPKPPREPNLRAVKHLNPKRPHPSEKQRLTPTQNHLQLAADYLSLLRIDPIEATALLAVHPPCRPTSHDDQLQMNTLPSPP